MPLYEYECDACGHKFERIQKFSDPLEKQCPECGGAVQKLISSPAIQFKGTGWYITDYARKGTGSDGQRDGAKSDGAKADGAKPKAKAGDSSATDTSKGASTDTSKKDKSSPTSESSSPSSTGPSSSSGSSSSDS
jgi:putative FmdB family regulatory protein